MARPTATDSSQRRLLSSRLNFEARLSMARPVHWTHDPRFGHLRNPPAWYNRCSPLYTPRPSVRMEKQAAEERRRRWQWHPGDAQGGVSGRSLLGAACWPCGIYARTSSRLRSALGGRDALNVPDPGCCNPECAQFALCLPCRSVLQCCRPKHCVELVKLTAGSLRVFLRQTADHDPLLLRH